MQSSVYRKDPRITIYSILVLLLHTVLVECSYTFIQHITYNKIPRSRILLIEIPDTVSLP